MKIRSASPADYEKWLPLWESYNTFYKRTISSDVTLSTWARFFDPNEPVFALVAEEDGNLLGFTHYLFHRHTAMIQNACYLQDLFTVESSRKKGVGKSLIAAVNEQAKIAGCKSIYWNTHESNKTGRSLYDKVAVMTGFLMYRQLVD